MTKEHETFLRWHQALIPGFGPKRIESVVQFFKNEHNVKVIRKLITVLPHTAVCLCGNLSKDACEYKKAKTN